MVSPGEAVVLSAETVSAVDATGAAYTGTATVIMERIMTRHSNIDVIFWFIDNLLLLAVSLWLLA